MPTYSPYGLSTEPIRVMHLLHTFGVGGMEVGITKLVNALDRSKVVSSICSCRPADSLKERLSPDVRLYELARRDGNDPLLVRRIARVARQERAQVIHTHRWATLCEGVIAARMAGVPFVVHGEHGTLETRWHNTIVQRWVWNRVDHVLSVSSRLAERMAGKMKFPLDRIRVIRNGVDLERFHPRLRHEGRARFGLRDDDFVIGSVGRLVAVKDQANWLRALALLRSWGLPFRAMIAGRGPLRDELMGVAASLQLDDVVFLGNRDDVPHVLAAFDVFVLSSESEGLSNTIQEAMATGLPVVATRVGGADELVDEPHTGLLVPSKDPRALAESLARVARSPQLCRQMGAAGRQRAEQYFGIDGMIREYERLYVGLTRRVPLIGRERLHEA